MPKSSPLRPNAVHPSSATADDALQGASRGRCRHVRPRGRGVQRNDGHGHRGRWRAATNMHERERVRGASQPVRGRGVCGWRLRRKLGARGNFRPRFGAGEGGLQEDKLWRQRRVRHSGGRCGLARGRRQRLHVRSLRRTEPHAPEQGRWRFMRCGRRGHRRVQRHGHLRRLPTRRRGMFREYAAQLRRRRQLDRRRGVPLRVLRRGSVHRRLRAGCGGLPGQAAAPLQRARAVGGERCTMHQCM